MISPALPLVPCRLTLANGSALPRRGEPVTWGVPTPQGWTASGDNGFWTADGSVRVVQADVLDRWPDGSARWTLLTLRVDTAGDSPATFLTKQHDQQDASTASAIGVRADDLAVVVDNGAMQVTFRPGGTWPVQRVTRGAHEACDAARSGLVVTLQGGDAVTVVIERVWVERHGPGHVLVRATGTHVRAGRPLLHAEWQVTIHAGLPVFDTKVTLRNPRRAEHPGGHWELGDGGSLLIEDVTVRIAAPAATPVAAAACSATFDEPLQPVPVPFAIYQESSGGPRWNGTNHVTREGRVAQRINGYTRSDRDGVEIDRVTPLVQATSASGTITLATRHFWQNCPKRLAVDGEGIAYGLWPGTFPDVHELQGGEQRTHEFAIAFGADGVTDVPLAWWRAPLVPVIDPAWMAASGAIPYLTPEAEDPHRAYVALVRQAVEGPDTFEHKRERVDEYGWRHFGDIYGDHEAVRHTGDDPLVSHYNNQYDPVFGFAVQFLRSGDPRWWPHCNDLAAHAVDIDIYHTTEDKAAYNNGLFWHTVHYIDAGKATHRSYPRAPGSPGGGPASEQNYTTGLMLHWFLTGNPLTREAAIGLGQFVIDIDDGSLTPFRWLDRGHTGLASASGSEFYHGPGRGSGNSLNALIDAHRLTGDERFLLKADQIVRRAVHPLQDIDALDLPDIERKWFYTMFLQSLGKYLDHRAELGRLDATYAYGRAALLHFARWMTRHEYPYLDKPDVLEFPTETWPAQDMRKSEVFKYAALHADDRERSIFLERAEHFFRYSVGTLAAHPRKSLARPVILLLAHGWRHAWATANPNATAPAPSQAATNWSPHQVFVPQKARAIRRAKLIVAAAAGAAAVALAALTAVLLF